MIDKFIKNLKESPLWVFAWGLFTLALGHNVAYEYSSLDVATYFQNKSQELSQLNAEYRSAESIVSIKRDTMYRLLKSMDQFAETFNKSFFPIADVNLLKARYIDFMIQSRGEITGTLTTIKNTGFTDSNLLAMRDTLEGDLMTIDRILERRITSLRALGDRPVDPARVTEELNRIDEQRGVSEAADRDRLVNFALDRARDRFNAAVREGKAKEATEHYRSIAAQACWAYIGGFVGAILGKMLYDRRMKRGQRAAPVDTIR